MPAEKGHKKSGHFDDLLVAVARTQDKASFITLFDYFAPRVKAFLMRGNMDEAEAEELAQETMLMVWQKAEQFDPVRATASTWIYTIARNKKIDRLRKSHFVMLDIDALTDTSHEPATTGNENDFLRGYMVDKLENAIAILPPEQAELVRKAFFEDMSHAEIAKKTDIPLGTVKSRLRMGLAKLRQSLYDDSPSDTL